MSSIVNKVKAAIHSDKPSEPEGTHGHHQSRVANAADPRIDSDRDHRAAHDFAGTGENYSHTGNYSAGSGAHNTTGTSRAFGGTDGPATKTDGPHESNLMNKVDPRVDSDRDHSRNMGANPHGTSGTGAFNVNETSRVGASHTAHQTPSTFNSGAPEGTYGTHNSRVANAVDPRIDSDKDGSRTVGNQTGTHTHNTATHGLGTSGATHSTATHGLGPSGTTHSTATHGAPSHGLGTSGVPEGTYGTHNSRVANAVDPRIDSDLDNSRTVGNQTGTHTHNTATHGLGTSGATHHNATHSTGLPGAGPAPNTAGPHKSDMMNKVDPRVDSDLDGSKTVGGDKTFSRSNEQTHLHKDPTDAAQVPPSVLKKHIGEPIISHDDHAHDRAGRHSISHQEQHRGL